MNMHSPISADRSGRKSRKLATARDFAAPTAMGLDYWKAKNNTCVEAEYAEAVALSEGHPALRSFVEAWLPLRRADANLSAIHTDMEERRAALEDEQAAEDLWHDAMDLTREAAQRVLLHVTTDPNESAAKVAVFNMLSEKPTAAMLDDEGNPNAIVESLLRDMSAQAGAHAERAQTSDEWNRAKDATHAALKAFLECPDEDEEQNDALGEALADAQERWESITPPSLEALVEVLSFSLSHSGPLGYQFQSSDCPRSMRDLLDSGDGGSIIAARVYMHLLRMTASTSPALQTPPIAGLYPAFSAAGHDNVQAAWKHHHETAEPYSARAGDLAASPAGKSAA